MKIYYIPLITAPIFIILWFAMSRALNQFNPWINLQSVYGSAVTGKGTTLRFQSALIDGARFVACLTYIFAIDGIYVRQLSSLPFLSREPGLFIPWEEIEIKKTDYWTTYPYEIHIKRVPRIDFRVRRQVGKALIRCQRSGQ